MDQAKRIKLIAAGAIFLVAFVVILYNLGVFNSRGPGSEGHIELQAPQADEGQPLAPEAETRGGMRLAPQ